MPSNAEPGADQSPIELSIIIPAHNEAATIGQQLEALTAQHWDGSWELLVVDNCSTDATAEVVGSFSRRDGRVRLVHATEVPSRNYARNVGIHASRGTAFALTDADDIVGPDWLGAMGDALRDHELVTGPLELDRLNPPELSGSRGRRHEWKSPMFWEVFPYAHGNNIGMQRAAWDRIGGFDEDPRLIGSEDLEISMRAWMNDIVLYFAIDAVVHYRYRTDPRVLWQQARRYGRSRPMVVRKLREAGRPRPPRFAGWRSWVWLGVHLPDLRTAAGRAGWVWVAGNRLGQLEGSIRYRSLFV